MSNVKHLLREERILEEELDLVFTPLHKRCLGVAVGAALALLVAAVTIVHMLRSPSEQYPLALLAQYFPGYQVSALGAAIGALWGFFVGFVVGWFFAFGRNLMMAITKLVFRTRAELAENRGFLDHI
jgi:hypothetical protein